MTESRVKAEMLDARKAEAALLFVVVVVVVVVVVLVLVTDSFAWL